MKKDVSINVDQKIANTYTQLAHKNNIFFENIMRNVFKHRKNQ